MWRSSFLVNVQACRLIDSNFTNRWTLSQVFFNSILSPPTPLHPQTLIWRVPHVLNTCGKPCQNPSYNFQLSKSLLNPESRGKSNEHLKYQNKTSPRGLGPKNLDLDQWDPKDLPSHKSRTLAPTFISKASFYPKSKVNSMNCTNVKMKLHPRAWDLKLSFGLTGSKRLTKL